jgi:hypothetical protein
MALQTLYAAETWDQVYTAFSQINFTSFDYESVKESLLQYMKLYYPEVFNDYIETSELIVTIDAFAVVAEQLAYRIDMATHENFITTAERKQNILKLAKLISYNASRNLPARGLVKLTSISTTESIIDSQGNDLSNRTIYWNDANNSLWKEQFFLVINLMLTSQFGSPYKTFQVGDVVFSQYSFNNLTTAFSNGVYPYSVTTNTQSIPMEIVSSDLDSDGVFEKTPDRNAQMYLTYADDGLGDGSDNTGFMMFTKQGSLTNVPLSFSTSIPNQVIDVNLQNINNTDVWINQVDSTGTTLSRWTQVDTINAQNIYFNVDTVTTKYEVESLENDKIRLLFGDGNFAAIPTGTFDLWVRQSLNSNAVIQMNRVVNQPMGFSYTSQYDLTETCSLTFSLIGSLQNAAASEDIEHIRRVAPSTYYSQGRMVNGQDYNTFLLRDSSILKLKAVNRTFSGQPTYINWNDPTGNYQNVKIFGDDLRMFYDMGLDSIVSQSSSRVLIDTALEPLLATSSIMNLMTYITSQDAQMHDIVCNPRTAFIEDATLGIQEKTAIQGLLDRHWYGEPVSYVTINGTQYANVSNDTDYLIWDNTIPRTIDGVTPYLNGVPSGLQQPASQPTFGIGFDLEVGMTGDGLISGITVVTGAPNETWTIEYVNQDTSSSTFTVTGSVSGAQGTATIGTTYSNDYISFTITQGDVGFVLGDAFVIDVVSNVGTQRTFTFDSTTYPGVNLNGKWYTITGTLLDQTDEFDNSYQTTTIPGFDRSWIFMINRITDSNGNILEWEIVYRDLQLTVGSDTTNFWYNSDTYLVDPDTQLRVNDTISILKSNLNKARQFALGTNVVYDVAGPILYNNGVVNVNELEVLPTQGSDGVTVDAMSFAQFVNAGLKYTYTQAVAASTWTITHNLDSVDPVINYVTISANTYTPTVTVVNANTVTVSFVDVNGNALAVTGIISLFDYDNVDYVYFTAADPSDPNNEETPVTATPAIKNLFPTGAMTSNDGQYVRKIGRDTLDFLWQHFSPNTNLIDPSTSNIIDMYVLTEGYYDSMMQYIAGTTTFVPDAPTPLDLRNSYSTLLASKMISDTVVMHSGNIKLLFGQLADSQLTASFRVIPSASTTLTNDQITAEVLDVINTFFNIDDWDFGDTFYATELIAMIHQRLPQDIASVVIVPMYVNNSFGSLFVIEAGEDEILQSCAQLSDIEIVSSFTATTLRQNLT